MAGPIDCAHDAQHLSPSNPQLDLFTQLVGEPPLYASEGSFSHALASGPG